MSYRYEERLKSNPFYQKGRDLADSYFVEDTVTYTTTLIRGLVKTTRTMDEQNAAHMGFRGRMHEITNDSDLMESLLKQRHDKNENDLYFKLKQERIEKGLPL